MADPQKNFIVSWQELHRDAKALAWRLHGLAPWKGLIAVTRGGLVPAAIVARELEIRIIETVGIVSRELGGGEPATQGKAKFVKHAANVGDGEGWLVLDDLVDTGRTVEVLRRTLPKAHYAALYTKPMGKPLVDTFITEVSQDTWIYLPWDIELQFTQPIAYQKSKKVISNDSE